MKFSLDHEKDPERLGRDIGKMVILASRVNLGELGYSERTYYDRVKSCLDSLNARMSGISSYGQFSRNDYISTRKDILILSKVSGRLLEKLGKSEAQSVTPAWIAAFSAQLKEVRSYTEYSPWWVIFLISISLGFGTMVGWKRIVVTIGEKIGKSTMTYAQGATANLIAAGTISISSMLGLPVSTTHVLSSGVAGTMVSGNGMKNLQTKTLGAIGLAWLITIPVTMLLSGLLFMLFRIIFT
jgi:PiT family inorganic phosphate transporter